MKTGISPNYVKGWNAEMAIREVVQNHLDTMEQFSCKGRVTHNVKNGTATFRDHGPGLALRHLALGVSEKGDGARGKYGEGLKLAMLVLARSGRNIVVHTEGRRITPYIAFDEEFGTELLHFQLEESTFEGPGTKVLVECSRDELDKAKGYFQEYTSRLDPDFQWVEKGKFSLPAGKIFVNGSHVGTMKELLFSYHFDEQDTGDIGNRDRTVIDQNKVKEHIKTALANTKSKKVWDRVFDALEDQKNYYVETNTSPGWYQVMGEAKGTVKRIIESRYKEHVVESRGDLSGHEESQLRRLGKNPLVVSFGWYMFLENAGFETVNQFKEKRPLIELIARDNLTRQERNNLDHAVELVRRYYHDPGLVQVMEPDGRRIGLCRPDGQIIIARSELHQLALTLDVLIHETVHQKAGVGDLTDGFQDECTKVMARMILQMQDMQARPTRTA